MSPKVCASHPSKFGVYVRSGKVRLGTVAYDYCTVNRGQEEDAEEENTFFAYIALKFQGTCIMVNDFSKTLK